MLDITTRRYAGVGRSRADPDLSRTSYVLDFYISQLDPVVETTPAAAYYQSALPTPFV